MENRVPGWRASCLCSEFAVAEIAKTSTHSILSLVPGLDRLMNPSAGQKQLEKKILQKSNEELEENPETEDWR